MLSVYTNSLYSKWSLSTSEAEYLLNSNFFLVSLIDHVCTAAVYYHLDTVGVGHILSNVPRYGLSRHYLHLFCILFCFPVPVCHSVFARSKVTSGMGSVSVKNVLEAAGKSNKVRLGRRAGSMLFCGDCSAPPGGRLNNHSCGNGGCTCHTTGVCTCTACSCGPSCPCQTSKTCGCTVLKRCQAHDW